MKKSVLYVVSPAPPPVGGVVSLAEAVLSSSTFDHPIKRITQIPVSEIPKWRRALVNFFIILAAAIRAPVGSKFLLFSGHGIGFYEKMFHSLTVGLFGGRPTILFVSGYVPSWIEGKSCFSRAVLNWILANSNIRIAAQTNVAAQYYLKTFRLQYQVPVLMPAVKSCFTTEICPSQKKPSSKKKKFLYVGWLSADKGIFRLLWAFANTKAQLNRCTLTLVGPDHTGGLLERYAQQLGIADLVIFRGVVTDDQELIRLYEQADAFVFPSKYEGLPLAVIEAMFSGLPCILGGFWSASELVTHGDNGLIVPSRRALKGFFDNYGKYDLQTMGANVRDRAKARFGRDKFESSYLTAFWGR